MPTLITDALPVEEDRALTYRVGEVARWFFGKTAHWLRWCERQGYLTVDGRVIGEREDQGSARSYNLREVEQIVVALASHEAISQLHASFALRAVENQADIYAMFEDPYEFEGQSYPLAVDDVAKLASRSTTWVRAHAVRLGGVRRQWGEARMQESWRFQEEGLDELIYEIQGES